MAANAREARRRKILDRGADRLALISGRSNTLPSDAPLVDSNLLPQQSPPLASQISASPNDGDGEISSKSLTNDSTIDAGCNVDSPLCTPETNIQASRTPASYAHNNENPPLASPPAYHRTTTPVAGSVQLFEQLFSNRFVSPSQISSAITATESARLLCSVVVAVFVVLSYLGFPLVGSNAVKSILCFRPLYLVLLTNLTLVIAKILLDNQRSSSRIVGGGNASSATFDWAEQAGNAIEAGLLMKKAIDAVVMDCSIYSIIVVAGFCILR